VSGCGPGGPARTTVAGKVNYKGQAVPTGTVAFVSGSTVTTGNIQNGQYSIPNVPVGENQISVTTPPAPSAGQQMQMKQKVEGKSLTTEQVKSITIPAKYARPESSGLTYTATSEKNQTYDIELVD
jgi:hypothetical protein